MPDIYGQLIMFIRNSLEGLIGWPTVAITSTLIIVACITFISLASSLATNEARIRELSRIVQEWEERRKRAIERRDRKLYEKVMREKARVDRIKGRISSERLKSRIVAALLWYVLFKITADVFAGKPVILFPLFNYARIDYATWFIVNSLWMFMPLSNLSMAMANYLKK